MHAIIQLALIRKRNRKQKSLSNHKMLPRIFDRNKVKSLLLGKNQGSQYGKAHGGDAGGESCASVAAVALATVGAHPTNAAVDAEDATSTAPGHRSTNDDF